MRRNLSAPDIEIKKKKSKIEITDEMLNNLKEHIAQMELIEKEK